MKSFDWKSTAELIGMIAIVSSLVFVGVQLQQDRELTQVSTFGSVVESNNALAGLIQAQSDVWVRGLDGDELTNSEKAIFSSMVQAVQSHYTNLMLRWTAGTTGRLDPQVAAQNLAYYVYIYPGLRRAFGEEIEISDLRNSAYETPNPRRLLRSRVLTHLQWLDETTPEIPVSKNYVIW